MATTIQHLLKKFAKQPGCEKYRSDGEKINLLTTYLWLRQLTPTLPFEVFLEKFTPLADYSEENLKHPEDAMRRWCPRNAKAAAAAGVSQWSAAEATKALAFYVDMVREAENQGTAVPLTLAAVLEQLGPEIKAGAFDSESMGATNTAGCAVEGGETISAGRANSDAETSGNGRASEIGETDLAGRPDHPGETTSVGAAVAAAPAAAKSKRTSKRTTAKAGGSPPDGGAPRIMPDATTATPERPTQVGQTIAYRMKGSERCVRGRVEAFFEDKDTGRTYVTFRQETGEIVTNVSVVDCEVILDTLQTPIVPTMSANLWIPKAGYEQTQRALALTAAMGNVALGDAITVYTHAFNEQLAIDLVIRNGEQGPFVEAELIDTAADAVLGSLPPRKELLGEYPLALDSVTAAHLGVAPGIYSVTAKLRGES